MRVFFLVGLLLGVTAAWASELRVSIVQGAANINSFVGAAGGHYSVQCPSTDGGLGQRVLYRPGCPVRPDGGVACLVDAGPGDVLMDFSANGDPYKIDLAVGEDRIHLRNADLSTNPLWCAVYRRSPAP